MTLTLTSLISSTIALPQYGSLAGLSKKELDAILRTLQHRDIPDPPEPIKDTGLKLVNDLKHPYQDPQPGDIRGPCPGLNTLANHGVCKSEYQKCFILIFLRTVSPSQWDCHAYTID